MIDKDEEIGLPLLTGHSGKRRVLYTEPKEEEVVLEVKETLVRQVNFFQGDRRGNAPIRSTLLVNLPNELLGNLSKFLSLHDLLAFRGVCRRTNNIVNDNTNYQLHLIGYLFDKIISGIDRRNKIGTVDDCRFCLGWLLGITGGMGLFSMLIFFLFLLGIIQAHHNQFVIPDGPYKNHTCGEFQSFYCKDNFPKICEEHLACNNAKAAVATAKIIGGTLFFALIEILLFLCAKRKSPQVAAVLNKQDHGSLENFIQHFNAKRAKRFFMNLKSNSDEMLDQLIQARKVLSQELTRQVKHCS